MAQICIPAPPLHAIRTIDLDVSIDGQPRHEHYRVETLEWGGDAAQRLDSLRRFIADRGPEWLLVQIGTPTDERVPLLFRLKKDGGGDARP